MLSDSEKKYCDEISNRLGRVKQYLNEKVLDESINPKKWHAYLSELRKIQGNLSNYVSFAATMMAKDYFSSRYNIKFDAAEKPQGASGIDIEVESYDGETIAAEIKTTVPYGKKDFGSSQANSFKKDFSKLSASNAKFKYLLVTDSRAFEYLKKEKYRKCMRGIQVVNLVSNEEFTA